MSNKSKAKSCVCTLVLKVLCATLGVVATVATIVGVVDQLWINHAKDKLDEHSKKLTPAEVLAKTDFGRSPNIFNFGGVVNVGEPPLPITPHREESCEEREEFPTVNVRVENVAAMDEMIDRLTAAYNRRDYVAATNCAAKAEELYLALTKPYVGKTVTVESNLVVNLFFLYSFRAEEALVRKDYEKALQLADIASNLSWRDPWPRHEALRSVIVMRKGMHDTHSRVYTGNLQRLGWKMNRRRKEYEYYDCLASWGYLIPVKIDYKNLSYEDFAKLDIETNFPSRLNYPYRISDTTTFPDAGMVSRGDVYFDRWLGFDKFEKFNLSEFVRRSIIDHYEERGMRVLTPEAVHAIR